MDETLMEECADWIAAQMMEEGYLIDPGLVHTILEQEWQHPERGLIGHERMAAELETGLAAAGIAAAPETVSAPLITVILGWEDDFLSFAGISRRTPS